MIMWIIVATMTKLRLLLVALITTVMLLSVQFVVIREIFGYNYTFKTIQPATLFDSDEDFINGQIIFNSSMESVYNSCLEVFESKVQSSGSNWKLKTKPCDDNVSVVIIIKSSITRNLLRRALRKTWAKDVSADFGK